MTPKQLQSKIKRLPSCDALTIKFDAKLNAQSHTKKSKYSSQKEHWIGWLSEIQGPGAYGRTTTHKTAESVYNRVMSERMLFWLMEASGVSRSKLLKVQAAALESKQHCTTRCSAMRKVVPWHQIEALLLNT